MEQATEALIARPSDDLRSCRFCLTYLLAPERPEREIVITDPTMDDEGRPVCPECWKRLNAEIQGKSGQPPESEEDRQARERRAIETEIKRLQARLRRGIG
jgi:hypothetical protein